MLLMLKLDDNLINTMQLITLCEVNSRNYYTSLSFLLHKNMTVVLLLHPNINCMTIPPVVISAIIFPGLF